MRKGPRWTWRLTSQWTWSLRLSPSTPPRLPLAVPGQVVTVHCEASGFAPLSLEVSWEFTGADGTSRSLGSGSLTGHRQAWDGTFSQRSKLELDTSKLDLGRGGEVTCVAVHSGGTRRARVTLNVTANIGGAPRCYFSSHPNNFNLLLPSLAAPVPESDSVGKSRRAGNQLAYRTPNPPHRAQNWARAVKN
ncbi:tapasin-like [Myripristis murdjan]|uniref:tapasin-like n=1 Tax=Myripristis murdjan TaxID=586833 RepID=UPI001175DBBF|nr:tapasin-like [Myripristis murdjan]